MQIDLQEGEELVGILVDIGGALKLRRVVATPAEVVVPECLKLRVFKRVFVHPTEGCVTVDGEDYVIGDTIVVAETWPRGVDTAGRGSISSEGVVALIKPLCSECCGTGRGDGIVGQCEACGGGGDYTVRLGAPDKEV